MTLALALGRTVAELHSSLSAEEFEDWLAFHSIEPIGGLRHDVGHAIVAATLANCHRGKNSRRYKITDFLPFEERRHQGKLKTPEQIQAYFQTLAGVRKRNPHP